MSEHKQEHTLSTILELFTIFNGFGIDHDYLWWRTDGEYAPVTMFVSCNDAFLWGTTDCEAVGPEDIFDLQQAVLDCKAAGDKDGTDGPLLWVARKRNMRPQGAMYEYLEKTSRPLFNSSGPEREIGLGNPKSNVVADD